MHTEPKPYLRKPWPPRALFAALFLITMAISIASATLLGNVDIKPSIFQIVNFTGPTALSLLHGGGLTVCTTEMGTLGNPICFHAARMLVPSLTVAAGYLVFGDRFVPVMVFKIILFLLPVEFAIFLALKRLPASPFRRAGIVFLLVAPFGMTLFIANVVNLPVEEDYAYSLIAFALAVILFGPFASPSSEAASARRSHPFYILAFALAVDALYLSKSSLSLAVAALTIAFFLQLRSPIRRVILIVLVAAAPIGWALHQHHASGRYSLGTSLDGVNLHKGNDAIFLAHYPPPPLTSLDDFDPDLNRGLYFPSEWSFNDYHLHAGIDYIRAHPRETLQAEWRKFHLLYISLTKYGSSDPHGLRLLIETAGLLLFRILFWGSIAVSLAAFFAPSLRSLRSAAVAYLALVAACALPYLIGFGYTRHASILIYPACLMGCRILSANGAPEVMH
jgi:hypothetical protein